MISQCGGGQRKKSAKSKLFEYSRSASSLRSVHCSVNIQYWRSDNYSPSGFPRCSGFPGRSDFPSPFSGFPVVLAFRSFWRSGRSSFAVVLTFLWSLHYKIYLKGRSGAYNATHTVYTYFLMQKSPIHFDVTSGNGN